MDGWMVVGKEETGVVGRSQNRGWMGYLLCVPLSSLLPPLMAAQFYLPFSVVLLSVAPAPSVLGRAATNRRDRL